MNDREEAQELLSSLQEGDCVELYGSGVVNRGVVVHPERNTKNGFLDLRYFGPNGFLSFEIFGFGSFRYGDWDTWSIKLIKKGTPGFKFSYDSTDREYVDAMIGSVK